MRVGVAFGGGVVRGWAHIGVLETLEQAGLRIDLVSGTSAGSIIAFGHAAGGRAAEMKNFAARFGWLRLIRLVWPRRGLVSFGGLRRLLDAEYGERDLSDLNIPCAVVTTDIETGESVVLTSGPAAPAVQASCSVPGFIEPVQIGGRLLCEGGLTDMVPVAPLRMMGADYVIGVDIFAFKVRRFLGPLGYGIAGLEIALERSGGGVDAADCLISPNLAGESYVRFNRRPSMIELGREAALLKLPQLRQDLGLAAEANLDPRLEWIGEPAG